MKKVVRFFLDNPLFANLLVIALMGLGISTLISIPKEAFPGASVNKIIITTIYPGASAKDVEINVTHKIEDKLAEVSGIDEMTSLSSENMSVITLSVDENADKEEFKKVYDDVEITLSTVDDLPMEIEGRPVMKELTIDDLPIIEIAISGEYNRLRNFIPYLEKELEKIEGIAQADVVGLPDEEVQILIDPLKARRYHVDLAMISRAIAARNLRVTKKRRKAPSFSYGDIRRP